MSIGRIEMVLICLSLTSRLDTLWSNDAKWQRREWEKKNGTQFGIKWNKWIWYPCETFVLFTNLSMPVHISVVWRRRPLKLNQHFHLKCQENEQFELAFDLARYGFSWSLSILWMFSSLFHSRNSGEKKNAIKVYKVSPERLRVSFEQRKSALFRIQYVHNLFILTPVRHISKAFRGTQTHTSHHKQWMHWMRHSHICAKRNDVKFSLGCHAMQFHKFSWFVC